MFQRTTFQERSLLGQKSKAAQQSNVINVSFVWHCPHFQPEKVLHERSAQFDAIEKIY